MKVLIVTSCDKKIFSYIDAADFFNYLVKEVGLTKDDIFFYGPAEYAAKISFHNIFFRVCDLTQKEPLVIYYSGHGDQRGWDFTNELFIAYEELAEFMDFKKRSAPLILINDCCYGMAAVDYFRGLNFKKVIFGLAPRDFPGQSDESGSFLLPELFKYWRKGMSALPIFKINMKELPAELRRDLKAKKISIDHPNLRYGDQIDYLLFPQKTFATRLYQVSLLFVKALCALRNTILFLTGRKKPS